MRSQGKLRSSEMIQMVLQYMRLRVILVSIFPHDNLCMSLAVEWMPLQDDNGYYTFQQQSRPRAKPLSTEGTSTKT